MPLKLFVPDKILRKIELKLIAIPPKEKFTYSDLSAYLNNFIKDELASYDKDLREAFAKFEGIESTNLRRAWSYEGKEADGAVEELRNLLCYYGYGKDWSKTLAELRIDESDIVKWTKQAKAKYKQQKGNGIEEGKIDTAEIKRFTHRIRIELTTRKAAIPFDEDHDSIEQVYDSWYKLFTVLRDELKTLPPSVMTTGNGAVTLTQEILNDVLRPHLTGHQAKFRSWLASAKDDPANKKLSPQALQKKYPSYKTLLSSLKQTNVELGRRANELSSYLSE